MVHLVVGNIGHLAAIVSFVASLAAAWSFFKASTETDLLAETSWQKFGLTLFAAHALGVFTVVISLFLIIYNHYYEYHYAWEHSSNHLPVYYMVSCFWEGQEGSFLLWTFWHVLLGALVLRAPKAWSMPAMTVFMLVQAFLCSMILGVVIGDLKIGSSPFILLRDYMQDAPVFKMRPDYVPEDGTGLNPLLQNYWMVIHPPTLFLGFALCLVPFSFCIAGLWKGKYKEWIELALPWAHVAALVLGLGIMMGAYWAYETLNFGGYWNWDPVENAVYVPWLVLVAAIHAMLIYKNRGASLHTAMLLVITTFLLILYSTFLTRSGILGNASVHSFTDLGLSGQLLLYLLFFVFMSIALLTWRWKAVPASPKEVSTYSKEFWVFLGITTLCLASFQILAMTSIPVYNALLKAVGISSKMAPPADQVLYYSNWQLWFGVGICLLSGVAQHFFWNKMDWAKLKQELYLPVVVTLLLTMAGITLTEVRDWKLIVLWITSCFTLVSNAVIFLRLWKSNLQLAGGAVAHIGVGLMLLGILYSAGYSKVVSLNNTGLVYSKEFSTDMNKENVLLFYQQPMKMGEYEVNYQGARVEAKGFPSYIHKNALLPTADAFKQVAQQDISYKGKRYFKQGDTLEVSPENTYYELEFKKEDGKTVTLYPRAQVNPQMGLIASPDILKKWNGDLYTHVSSIPDPKEEKEWAQPQEQNLGIGDTFFLNDYVAKFEKVERLSKVDGIDLQANDVAIQAHISLMTKQDTVYLKPKLLIKDGMLGRIMDEKPELGVRMVLVNVFPEKNEFQFSVQTSQKEWVILKALHKPHINVLWLGTLLVLLGFGLAIWRRGGKVA
jgi:cytochrome c-type biogenesis protein CcmF